MVAFFALLSLVSGGLCLLMATVVYYGNPGKSLNRAFALFCLFVGFWAFGEFMHRQADSIATAELWMKIVGVVWPIAVTLLFHSVLIFTGNVKGIGGRIIYIAMYTPALFFSVLAVSTHYLSGELVKEYWGYTKTVTGDYPLITVSSAWAVLMGVVAFGMCLRYFLKSSDAVTRNQAKYMLIGLAAPITSGVITEGILPPFHVRIPELSTVSMLWACFFFAYAMKRHSLFVISNVTAANNIVSTMSDCLILLDTEGKTVAINKATSDLLGYPESDLVGTPARSIFTDPHQEDGGMDELIAGKPLRNRDFILRTRSGEAVPVIVSSSALMDKKGGMGGVVCIARDITDRKKMEEAVRVSEEKLRAIYDSMKDGLVVTDKDVSVLQCNNAALEIVGVAREEVIGRPGFDVLMAEDRQTAIDGISKQAAGMPMEMRSYRIQSPGGAIKHIEMSVSALKGAAGTITGFVIVMRDVTERIKMEDALRLSEEKLRAVYTSMKDGLIVTDKDIRIVQCNDAALELSGFTREQVIGRPGMEILILEDRQRALDEIGKQFSGQPVEMQSYSIRLPSGAIKHMELSISSLKDADGSITGFVVVMRDVTERIKMANELQKLLGELKRSNTDLEQFAYVASHDLQEPLRMVSSYLSLLAKRYKGKLDTEADEFIGFAVDGATRMQRMIQDLLTYSRVTTQGKALLPVELDVVFSEAIDNLKVSIDENKATVTHDHLPQVMADASQMVRLFQNLVSNALKFHGKEPPVIHVGCKEGPEEWTISVKDNGIGIDPKQFNRLFIIFQRLVTREQYPGTGIGLAVCKRTVERHGGRIWAESEGEGKGTTFLFTLPKKDFSKTAEAKSPATESAPQSK